MKDFKRARPKSPHKARHGLSVNKSASDNSRRTLAKVAQSHFSWSLGLPTQATPQRPLNSTATPRPQSSTSHRSPRTQSLQVLLQVQNRLLPWIGVFWAPLGAFLGVSGAFLGCFWGALRRDGNIVVTAPPQSGVRWEGSLVTSPRSIQRVLHLERLRYAFWHLGPVRNNEGS